MAQLGNTGWDWDSVLPFFKKAEAWNGAADDLRGSKGPLRTAFGRYKMPLFDAFLNAGKQAGYKFNPDYNSDDQEGFVWTQYTHTHRFPMRCSAARAYVWPALRRKNLAVWTKARVLRLVMDGKRVTGVELEHKGRCLKVNANREVILSAGAYHSPQLLMLSGIGDPVVLASQGIDCAHALKGVGKNLQDHLEVYVQYACTKPVSMQPNLALWRRPIIGLQWLFRKGPGATNHFEGGGFIRSNDDVAYPNTMFHFLPIAIRYDGTAPPAGHGYQVHVGPMYSDSRGWIKIKSADPFEKPAIQFNYISTETDRREWVEVVKAARNILTQRAMDEFNGGEISPGSSVSTDEEILEWVRKDAETALHPSCTARLGVDDMSVTDPLTMKVHGVEGLRVVDASAMRYVTNGNIYAPVMMLAEKAADLVAGNTPLAPEHVDFYRAPGHGG